MTMMKIMMLMILIMKIVTIIIPRLKLAIIMINFIPSKTSHVKQFILVTEILNIFLSL